MKILYVCGTYCPAHGGAEISIHTLLKELVKRYDVEVLVVTDKRYTENKDFGKYDSIDLYGTSHEEREVNIIKAMLNFKPDIVLTQLMWSDIALKIAKENSIPSILRVCKIPFNIDISHNSIFSPTLILSVSQAVRFYVLKEFGRLSEILIPPIILEDIIVPEDDSYKEPFDREFITMFNPLKRKGGLVFKEIAKKLPEKRFAVILGWSSLKNKAGDKDFSDELLRRISESLGKEYSGNTPEYVDFNDCPNVMILEPEDDVRKIYSRTKLLLIPSQWEEAFGRVAVEGMVNSIPVIGSEVGGLKEAIGRGGIILKDYSNPEEWLKEIRRLEDKKYYDKISMIGRDFVTKSYSIDEIISKMWQLLEKISTLSAKC